MGRGVPRPYGCFLLWLDCEHCVLDIEEPEDGREEGDEFATGDDLLEEQDDGGDQQGEAQEGGAIVAEDSGFHNIGFKVWSLLLHPAKRDSSQ